MTVKSNFKLDDRIKSIDDIQTIVCNNRGFIGCKGFFFDEFVKTKDLTKCHYGTLVDIDIKDSDDHCFKARDENGNDLIGYYRFFIPEDSLKPVEKTYRAFTNEEFFKLFDAGKLHSIRKKNERGRFIITEVYFNDNCEKDTVYVKLNHCGAGFAMRYLSRNDFEYFDGKEWKPFGVEE